MRPSRGRSAQHPACARAGAGAVVPGQATVDVDAVDAGGRLQRLLEGGGIDDALGVEHHQVGCKARLHQAALMQAEVLWDAPPGTMPATTASRSGV